MLRKYRLQEQVRDGADGGSGGDRRPSAAESNANRNRERLSRIEEISQGVDGRRASELQDTDGERVTGRFQAGEFDDSPEARERQAQLEADEAESALQERRELAEAEEQREARRLQSDGVRTEDGDRETPKGEDDGTARSEPLSEAADEKVINGVRHYLTVVGGAERWLTLRELRENASRSAQTEETLQRAEDALQRATQAALTPKVEPAEVPDEKDLENIILSASMGDEEAVRKLASVVRSRPNGATQQDVSRLVAQQIATQREVDRAEQAQQDFLGSDILAPIFKARLTQFAQEKPKTKIDDAYRSVGDQMRKDFAAMIKTGQQAQPSKVDRKRGIVNPPTNAGRQQQRQDEDREVPVADQIDAIAKARGQLRAHRIRRS